MADWDGGPVYQQQARLVYDAHGRVTEAYDPLDRKTMTGYTPATGGPVTQVVSTSADPDGAGPLTAHSSTTTLDPAWGVAVQVVDPNGKVTAGEYDPLGRLVGVWLPGRDPASQSASFEYAYTVRASGPNAVTTRRLNPAGEYVTGTQIFDGLLRARQAQGQAPVQFGQTEPGRTLTDTTYDSRGLLLEQRGPAYNTDPPDTTVLLVPDGQMPSRTRYTYDGAARQVDHGVEHPIHLGAIAEDQITAVLDLVTGRLGIAITGR